MSERFLRVEVPVAPLEKLFVDCVQGCFFSFEPLSGALASVRASDPLGVPRAAHGVETLGFLGPCAPGMDFSFTPKSAATALEEFLSLTMLAAGL